MIDISRLKLDNPFWRFSLKQWQYQALQEQLLSLQDKKGIRINLILLAMWLSFDRKDLRPYRDVLLKHTHSWHSQIVAPLRKIRQSLPKDLPNQRASLKTQVQSCELQAEQIEQALLFEACVDIKPESSTNLDSLDWLLINLRASDIEESDLFLLIRNCLPNYPEHRIRERMKRA